MRTLVNPNELRGGVRWGRGDGLGPVPLHSPRAAAAPAPVGPTNTNSLIETYATLRVSPARLST